jgi:hypothetical protein
MAPWLASRRLSWAGPPTVSLLTANLFNRQRTVLRLPTSYHPAVSSCLYGNTRIRRRIDLTGGARLLARIAEIEGLGELARLLTTMQIVGARLRLRSPAPHLIFNVSAVPRVLRVRTVREPWTALPAAEECPSCGMLHGVKTPPRQF